MYIGACFKIKVPTGSIGLTRRDRGSEQRGAIIPTKQNGPLVATGSPQYEGDRKFLLWRAQQWMNWRGRKK
jgi:hypothetical protein